MNNDLTYAGGKVRLFVASDLFEGANVVLSSAQTHYLLRVMRSRAGGRVRLFNGRDGEWLAVLGSPRKRDFAATCERRTEVQSDTPDVWSVFAPIKRVPNDYVAQKATELGARKLIPVLTKRTIVTRVNAERMLVNAIEAAEQQSSVLRRLPPERVRYVGPAPRKMRP